MVRVQDTLALTGNASNYISQTRRTAFMNSISKSRPKLSSFMKEICKVEKCLAQKFERRSQREPTKSTLSTKQSARLIIQPNHPLVAFFIQGPDCKVRRRVGQKLYSVQKVLPTQPQLQRQPRKLPKPEVSRSQTQGIATSEQSVRGILRYHLPAWHQITDNAWVLQCIQGYHLEFGDTLPHNNPPPPQATYALTEASTNPGSGYRVYSKRTQLKALQDERDISILCSQSPKKDGSWRPIINLKCLSTYLEVPHFKMDGISTLKDVLQKNDFMGKIDLKDAYLASFNGWDRTINSKPFLLVLQQPQECSPSFFVPWRRSRAYAYAL